MWKKSIDTYDPKQNGDIQVVNGFEEVTQDGGNLPGVTAEDNGKSLLVSEGHWTKAFQLPQDATAGDVLTASSEGWVAAAPASQLPEITTSNNGETLTVINGAWVNSTVFTFEITGDGSQTPFATEVTPAEVQAAITEGKQIRVVALGYAFIAQMVDLIPIIPPLYEGTLDAVLGFFVTIDDSGDEPVYAFHSKIYTTT